MCREIICAVSLSLTGKPSKVPFKNGTRTHTSWFEVAFWRPGLWPRWGGTGVFWPHTRPLWGPQGDSAKT